MTFTRNNNINDFQTPRVSLATLAKMGLIIPCGNNLTTALKSLENRGEQVPGTKALGLKAKEIKIFKN